MLKFLLVLDLELRDVVKNSIKYMRKVSNVLVKGWIIYPYRYEILDSCAKALHLLPSMPKSSSVVEWPVVVWWPCIGKAALSCSFKPFIKCSRKFSYVLIITV